MFVLKDMLVLLSALFVFSDAALVDNLVKCDSEDQECLKDLYKTALLSVGTEGIPELDIPPIDPFNLKNVSISPFGFAKITFVDSVVTGIKDCELNAFSIELEWNHAKAELTCDITLQGNYLATPLNPFLVTMLGGSVVRGDGKAKVKLSKINIKLDFYLTISKRDDGEIYVTFDSTHTHYKYDVLDKVSFDIDGFYIDNKDSSALIKDLLNNNWKTVFYMAGSSVMDLTMKYVYTYTNKFFESVPAKHYLADDMTPFLESA